MTVGRSVGDALRIHGIGGGQAERRQAVLAALERVGLAPGSRFIDKYPGELSGGQKQRAVIARAIILGPKLLVADEPISMLDMSVRAKILGLLDELRRDLGLTYVYITHDLASARFFCDRVAIMYLGKIVEIGPVAEIFANPRHPYTKALLGAVPDPDPSRPMTRDLPRGEVPDAARPPRGCSFHPRCPKAFEVCGWESRDLRDLLEARWAQMSEEDFTSERALFDDLDVLDRPSTTARLKPGAGASAEQLLDFLERFRAEDPEEPFWKGVKRMETQGETVELEWHEPIDPRLLDVGGARVECHLYDEEALAAAERARRASVVKGAAPVGTAPDLPTA
jgi:peptide/nickel transport system ATP-binding protein